MAGRVDQEAIKLEMDSKTVVATKQQLECDLPGEKVILDLNSDHYFGMNAVASRIWTLIQEPIETGDIVEKLLEEYEVEREQAERDVERLLAEMKEKGLVEYP